MQNLKNKCILKIGHKIMHKKYCGHIWHKPANLYKQQALHEKVLKKKRWQKHNKDSKYRRKINSTKGQNNNYCFWNLEINSSILYSNLPSVSLINVIKKLHDKPQYIKQNTQITFSKARWEGKSARTHAHMFLENGWWFDSVWPVKCYGPTTWCNKMKR